MKLFILAALAASASAFAPSRNFGCRSRALYAETSSAIEQALEASKKYGASSPEARVLWDIVEEMNASDNSIATKPALKDSEYEAKVKALSSMLETTKSTFDQVKQLAADLRGVKLAIPNAATSSPDDDAMKEALAAARAATEKFGMDSAEARLAWETVEEIASNADDEAIRRPLDEECLIELIEGCEALEKFKAALESR